METKPDLFNPLWEKKTHKRIYYKATASNGAVALRGSWQDKYSHACIRVTFDECYENQLTYASFHARQDLAQRATNYANKNTENKFECVALEQISAKEFNRLRRLDNKNRKKYWQEQYSKKIAEMNENELAIGGN